MDETDRAGALRDRLLSHDQAELRRDRLLQLPVFLRAELLRRIWRQAGWPEAGMSAKRWRRLASLARSGRINRLAIGGGVEVSTTGKEGWPPDAFVLRRAGGGPPPLAARKGRHSTRRARLGIVARRENFHRSGCRYPARRDDRPGPHRPASLGPPTRPGDRFEPLGMGGKSRPLNDFFRGRRVGREERTRTPLLCDALGIIWVVGHRIAERVKVTEQTARTLGLRWQVDPRG